MNAASYIELKPNKNIPDFRVGDTVRVHAIVVEGERRRTQAFEGVVIRRKRGGVNSSFTVRRVSHGVGIERVFPFYSPLVEKVEVTRVGRVRQARLYYLRDRVGKAARLKAGSRARFEELTTARPIEEEEEVVEEAEIEEGAEVLDEDAAAEADGSQDEAGADEPAVAEEPADDAEAPVEEEAVADTEATTEEEAAVEDAAEEPAPEAEAEAPPEEAAAEESAAEESTGPEATEEPAATDDAPVDDGVEAADEAAESSEEDK